MMSIDVCVFKQKTADAMRISDWSADVCSSDLLAGEAEGAARHAEEGGDWRGGIASAALAVAVGAPVLLTVELVGDLAAEAASARRHHASSRSPLSSRRRQPRGGRTAT